MNRSDMFFFAFEGGNGWSQLLVVEARGKEAMSAGYEYTIDLALADGATDVAHDDLVGARATLRIMTEVDPAVRLVHGIITEVEEVSVEKGGRIRVKLAPPYSMAKLWKKSIIHVDKKIQDFLTETLERTSSGMALTKSGDDHQEVTDQDWSEYKPFKATYAFRNGDLARLQDTNARPYCVQYQETDVDFLSRILEEEGIAYHFEHTLEECVLVMSDADLGCRNLHSQLTIGQDLLHRSANDVRAGGRLRPKAVALRDYDYRKPDHELVAGSPGLTEQAQGITVEDPARYQYSTELGSPLAKFREEQFDSERSFAAVVTNCRALSAGTLFTLDHPKFAGVYLLHKMEVHLKQRASFSQHDEDPYIAKIEALHAGATGSDDLSSKFRPARVTHRPKVFGTQTAVVTAEPGQDGQEINVGGEGDFGSVRVRFHWDLGERGADVPSSCWIRVSQMFAGGRGHGALFSPRVGDEVIVDYLEGDPDRPIITGRVYNGKNLSPENATKRPTYSCIKSMTSPFNGNYNMMAFDDLQGEEKFIIHVAKDFIANILHNSSRIVANFDKVEVKGNQETLIHGNQNFTVLANQAIKVGGNQFQEIGANQTTHIGGTHTAMVGGSEILTVSGDQTESIGGDHHLAIGGSDTVKVGASRGTQIGAVDTLNVGAMIIRKAGASILDTAPAINIEGTTITAHGTTVTINGDGTVSIKGGTVNVDGGVVNIKGGPINLNC